MRSFFFRLKNLPGALKRVHTNIIEGINKTKNKNKQIMPRVQKKIINRENNLFFLVIISNLLINVHSTKFPQLALYPMLPHSGIRVIEVPLLINHSRRELLTNSSGTSNVIDTTSVNDKELLGSTGNLCF